MLPGLGCLPRGHPREAAAWEGQGHGDRAREAPFEPGLLFLSCPASPARPAGEQKESVLARRCRTPRGAENLRVMQSPISWQQDPAPAALPRRGAALPRRRRVALPPRPRTGGSGSRTHPPPSPRAHPAGPGRGLPRAAAEERCDGAAAPTGLPVVPPAPTAQPPAPHGAPSRCVGTHAFIRVAYVHTYLHADPVCSHTHTHTHSQMERTLPACTPHTHPYAGVWFARTPPCTLTHRRAHTYTHRPWAHPSVCGLHTKAFAHKVQSYTCMSCFAQTPTSVHTLSYHCTHVQVCAHTAYTPPPHSHPQVLHAHTLLCMHTGIPMHVYTHIHIQTHA